MSSTPEPRWGEGAHKVGQRVLYKDVATGAVRRARVLSVQDVHTTSPTYEIEFEDNHSVRDTGLPRLSPTPSTLAATVPLEPTLSREVSRV
jgi:hypothetical protein